MNLAWHFINHRPSAAIPYQSLGGVGMGWIGIRKGREGKGKAGKEKEGKRGKH